MRKCIIIFTALVILRSIGLCQTLTAYDGELWYAAPGYIYTIQPVPFSDTSVSPIITGGEWGEPMTFTLTSNPGDQFQVSFTLMSDASNCEPALISSLSSNALRRENTNSRFDPNLPQTFILDFNGSLTLNLGITVQIPSDSRRSYFSAAMTCLAVNVQTGDSISTHATFFIGLGGLISYGGESYLNNLSKGFTYSITLGSINNQIVPTINGDENTLSIKFQSDAIMNALIELTFVLPAYLEGEKGDSIPCIFSSDALYIEETGQQHDPHNPVITRITSSCTITFDMGITVVIPEDAISDWYYGVALVSARYIGNFKNKQQRLALGDAEFTFLVDVDNKEIPESFSLSQNFPNPFNSGTKIRFGLPDPTNVNLTIFDVLGREIATLVNEFRYAGMHTVDWQADGLSTGLYFYKLTAGKHTEVKKLNLIR